MIRKALVTKLQSISKCNALAHAPTTSLAQESKNVSIDSIVLHKVNVRFTSDPCGKEEKALFVFNIFTFIPFPLIPSLPSRPSFPWVWKKIKLFNGDDYKREREELTQKKAEENKFECHVSAWSWSLT